MRTSVYVLLLGAFATCHTKVLQRKGQDIPRSQSTGRKELFILKQNFHNVVGGEIAMPAEFPYMVAIGFARVKSNATADIIWGCGGSLISKFYVLTAAHCVTDAQTQNIRPVVLRTGVNKLNQGPRVPEDYSVASFKLHPKHKASLKYHDLALMRTDRAVAMSASVSTVRLPTASDRVDNATRLFAAGWGATDPSGFVKSADLKKAEIQYVPLEECKKRIPANEEIPRGLGDDMICAADPKGESDTCRGDSGGPLVARQGNQDTLVGVTSFGGNPCAGATPGVYARVSPEITWIKRTMGP